MSKIWKTAPTKAFKAIKPVVHYGFVPLIIYIAMKQEPQLTCVALALLLIFLCWATHSYTLALFLSVYTSRLWQIVFPLASPAEPAQLQ